MADSKIFLSVNIKFQKSEKYQKVSSIGKIFDVVLLLVNTIIQTFTIVIASKAKNEIKVEGFQIFISLYQDQSHGFYILGMVLRKNSIPTEQLIMIIPA